MSRHNFIGGSSTTGGASALTLVAVSGLALPAAAFVSSQPVEYSVQEFTDATRSTLVRSETGFGTVSSGNVLTRTAPRTTWNGTTYSQNSPSALSFGTSNVLVLVAPIAEGGPTAFSARANFTALVGSGPNEWVVPANMLATFDYPATVGLAANSAYMVPIFLQMGFALSTLAVKVTTPQAGATVNLAIAALRPDNGVPGTILASANGVSVAAGGITSASAGPRLLSPGWYWALLSFSAASVAIRGAESVLPNPMGGLGVGDRLTRYNISSRPHADFTVGADAMAGITGAGGVNNATAPLILLR